jgi:hypothetical protein
MDDTIIHITSFGSFPYKQFNHSNWTDSNTLKELGSIGLLPTSIYIFYPRTFEIVDKKLFSHAIIKYEIQHESVTEYKRNLISEQLKTLSLI